MLNLISTLLLCIASNALASSFMVRVAILSYSFYLHYMDYTIYLKSIVLSKYSFQYVIWIVLDIIKNSWNFTMFEYLTNKSNDIVRWVRYRFLPAMLANNTKWNINNNGCTRRNKNIHNIWIRGIFKMNSLKYHLASIKSQDIFLYHARFRLA